MTSQEAIHCTESQPKLNSIEQSDREEAIDLHEKITTAMASDDAAVLKEASGALKELQDVATATQIRTNAARQAPEFSADNALLAIWSACKPNGVSELAREAL